MELTNEQIFEIEKQLSCPEGEMGKEIGNEMLRVNANMIQSAVNALGVQEHDRIIELGHGNGGHIDDMFSSVTNVFYSGLEISKTMNEVAIERNQDLIAFRKAQFLLYDGIDFPLENDSSTKLFSVNNIYFWKQPQKTVSEIIRVLKPKGKAIIVLADETYLRNQVFTQNIFTIYSEDQLLSLFESDGIDRVLIDKKQETIINTTGVNKDRNFLIVTVIKK